MPALEDHPLACIFPLMGDADLAALADDIDANGLRDAVWLYEGKILDGRNRYRACVLKDVDPRVEHYRGKDPLGFVISKNLHRRHLTESQRAMVAANIATAKAGDNQHGEVGGNSPRPTNTQAAEMLGVSPDLVKDAKAVKTHGTPELVEAVESGEVTVSAAAEVAKLPKADQEKLVEAGPAAVKSAAKNQRAKKKEATGATKTKPAAKAEAGAETARPAGDGAGGGPADGGGGTPDGGHAAGDTGVAEAPPVAAKSRPVPTVDAWGIPIQEHAAEAFKAVPKFKELIALLRTVRGELTALCDSPGGRLLLRRCQFARADNKAGGRWVLAELDNAIGVMEDATPAHTDCPYHFNEFQPHGEKAEGRPCHLCDNKRFTGNLKRFQVPAPMLAAMREFYGVTEGA